MTEKIDEIRVFVSSTFQDMEPERAYLVRKVFPELRMLAEKRGISFIPVDLRWGITDEEARSGKVLEICLYEIDNSKPFFIGLLGDRYGWCPDETEFVNNPVLLEKWGDWLREDIHSGVSVTEIEMQYGVLRNPETINAVFYMRKGSTDPQVAQLRKKIERDGRYPVIEYSTPEELGWYVRETYSIMINDISPEEDNDELGKAVAAKLTFYTSKSLYYHPSKRADALFDNFINASHTPGEILCLTDKSGMGKSAWMVSKYLENFEDAPRELVCAFADDGYSCGDYRKIVKILALEICDLYGIDDIDIEDSDPDLLLAIVFNKIPKDRPLTVMIDGLNHLDDFGPAKGLGWLPPNPENVSYILSTLPDDNVIDVLKARNTTKTHVTLTTIGTPDENDRARIVSEYLEIYGKRLDESGEYAARIARWPLSRNSFILRALLDDLINFGKHETIHSYLEAYLKTESADDFFNRLIEGYELEFGHKRVADALGLIAFSNNGLSEQELKDISRLRQLEWSELRYAIKPFLRTHGSLTSFSHHLLLDAVKKRYAAEESTIRSRIIDYFDNTGNYRAYQEVARQLLVLERWDSLYNLLLDYDVFQVYFNNRPYELAALWKQLSRKEIGKKHPSVSDYINVAIAEPDHRLRFLLDAGTFALEYYDSYKDTGKIMEQAIKEIGANPSPDHLLTAKVYEAYAKVNLLTSTSIVPETNVVFPYLKASFEIKKNMPGISEHEWAETYELLALAFSMQHEEKIAAHCFKKAFTLFAGSKGPGSAECARCASICGRTLQARYIIEKAIGLKINLTGDNHPWLIEDYKSLAKVLVDKDRSRKAAEKAVTISLNEFGDTDRRSRAAKNYSLANLIFFRLFDFDFDEDTSWFKISLGSFKILFLGLSIIALVIGIPLAFILLWVFCGFKSAYIYGCVCLLISMLYSALSEISRKRSIQAALPIILLISPLAVILYFIPGLIEDFSNNWSSALVALILSSIPFSIIIMIMQKRTQDLNQQLGFNSEKAESDLEKILKSEITARKQK